MSLYEKTICPYCGRPFRVLRDVDPTPGKYCSCVQTESASDAGYVTGMYVFEVILDPSDRARLAGQGAAVRPVIEKMVNEMCKDITSHLATDKDRDEFRSGYIQGFIAACDGVWRKG